jgi:hypothetical protein
VCVEKQDLEKPLLLVESSSQEQTTNATSYFGVVLGVSCAWAAFYIVPVLGVFIFLLTNAYAMVLCSDMEQDDDKEEEKRMCSII